MISTVASFRENNELFPTLTAYRYVLASVLGGNSHWKQEIFFVHFQISSFPHRSLLSLGLLYDTKRLYGSLQTETVLEFLAQLSEVVRNDWHHQRLPYHHRSVFYEEIWLIILYRNESLR